MQQGCLNDNVVIDFAIFSEKELDFGKISSKLNCANAKIRGKEDFPIEEFAVNEWSVRSKYEKYKCISKPLEDVMGKFYDKADEIIKIRNDFEASIIVNILISSESKELPELWIPEKIIAFLGEIGAQIGISIMTDI